MWEYLAHFATLAAALVAVTGHTFDESKRGLKRVTAVGWTAILVAAAGFLVSSVLTWNQKTELRAQRQGSEHLSEIAQARIRDSLDMLAAPIFEIEQKVGGLKFSNSNNDHAKLLDNEFLELLGSFNVNEASTNKLPYQGAPYYEALAAHARTGKSEIRQLLAVYGTLLSTETVVGVEKVIGANYVTYLEGINEWAKEILRERAKSVDMQIACGASTCSYTKWFPLFDMRQSSDYLEFRRNLDAVYALLPRRQVPVKLESHEQF